MAGQIEPRLHSADDYEKMIEAGILGKYDRVELLRSEIVPKLPKSMLHSSCVARLGAIFRGEFGLSTIVWSQNPIRISDNSIPEPDVALLKPHPDFYCTARPTAKDVLLLIEVADSTLQRDRELKLPIYAEARITEYWIVNLVEGVVEAYAVPVEGAYTEIHHFRHAEAISPRAFPNVVIPVNEITGELPQIEGS